MTGFFFFIFLLVEHKAFIHTRAEAAPKHPPQAKDTSSNFPAAHQKKAGLLQVVLRSEFSSKIKQFQQKGHSFFTADLGLFLWGSRPSLDPAYESLEKQLGIFHLYFFQ